MARNTNFESSMKKFRKSLQTTIDYRAQDICRKASWAVAETFAEVASKRLVEGATPLDSVSRAKVEAIANSITEYQKDETAVASIPIDEEGLALYLEYGTGLIGEQSNDAMYAFSGRKTDSDRVNWSYAINRDRYKTLPSTGKKGWYFTKKPDSYIDANDTVIERTGTKTVLKMQFVQPKRKTKSGKPYKPYFRIMRYKKAKKSSVFTEGLVPIRYFGRTQADIRAILREAKAGGVKGKSSVEDMITLLNQYRAKHGLELIQIY